MVQLVHVTFPIYAREDDCELMLEALRDGLQGAKSSDLDFFIFAHKIPGVKIQVTALDNEKPIRVRQKITKRADE